MGFARTTPRVAKRVSISPRLSLLGPIVKCTLSVFLHGHSRTKRALMRAADSRWLWQDRRSAPTTGNLSLLRGVNLLDTAWARLDVLQAETEERRRCP